jgi:hypothetical protein
VSATSQDGSLLFTLSSTDMVASNRRKSVLSLTMNLTGTGVRIHSDSIQTNYTMLYAKQNMKLGDVKAQIGPAIDQYFKTKIPSVPDFLTFLDTRAEESVPNGPNLLGNGLISLQVSLSADAAKTAGNAWLSLPTSKQSGVYGDMSRAIQRSVKAAVHDSYFRDQDAYFNTDTARTILAYCALVPAAPVPSGLNGQPLWDTADSNARRQMLSHPQTLAKMKDLLGTAQKALDGLSKAQFFEPDDAEQILKNIVTNGQGLQGSVFQNLLLAESEIVRKAFEGGLAIAKGIASARPSDAVAAIADFGSSLTDAFNASITSLLGPGLRALGTRVFLDASAAIVQQQGQLQTSALLSIEFLKPEVKFDSAALLAAGHIEAAQLAFSDRAVQI